MGLIKGRPTLDVINARAQTSAVNALVTQQLLRVSPFLQLLEFDNSTMPNGRSGRLVFPYQRKQSARVAQLRNYYADYEARFATPAVQDVQSILRPIGDAWELDRVFARADAAWEDEQLQMMLRATNDLFLDLTINGNATSNAQEFNGLSKILTGTAQEISGTGMDFSAGATLSSGGDPYAGQREMIGSMRRQINKIKGLGLTPIILSNDEAQHRIQMLGEKMGYRTMTPDQFGENEITTLSGAYMIDSGQVTRKTGAADGTTGVIPTATAEIIPTVNGLTDIYIIGISRINGFCGVTIDGSNGVNPVEYRTSRTDAGVVVRGEVEAVASVALMDERAAVVYRGVRVLPAA